MRPCTSTASWQTYLTRLSGSSHCCPPSRFGVTLFFYSFFSLLPRSSPLSNSTCAGKLAPAGSLAQSLATLLGSLQSATSSTQLPYSVVVAARKLSRVAPNNSFKPNLLRYTKAMAEKACHGFGSTTQVGLTQALGA